MKFFTAIIEKDIDTNLYVGYVPGFLGAHSQGETLDELRENLQEVIEMLLEDSAITAVEDIALAKAIAEGLDGENVSREEVFALLSE
ncbi:MAG: type II toxin-antitoxin system HicB family antitoxin [Snowella sp.]|nr:type II toxin-antitoxin system HicB family antitoxin [Snowella sp.]